MLSSTLSFNTLIKNTSQGEEKERNSNVSASKTSMLDFHGSLSRKKINALKVQDFFKKSYQFN